MTRRRQAQYRSRAVRLGRARPVQMQMQMQMQMQVQVLGDRAPMFGTGQLAVDERTPRSRAPGIILASPRETAHRKFSSTQSK
jgi:hypothetical protein